MPNFTFNQHEKLKSKKLIEFLFKNGKSFNSFPYRVIYIQHTPSMNIPESVGFVANYPAKFGISVSTKKFKRAVDRNKVKRLSREIWRLHKHLLYLHLITQQVNIAVFFIYTQSEILTYNELEKGIIAAIHKLKNITETVNTIV